MSEQDPKRPGTPGEEQRPAVYMVPHPKLKEQEIQVTDVVLPTLRYKWQVAAVVIVGLLLGIFISLRYGETLYSDRIEYIYRIPPIFRPEPVLPFQLSHDQNLGFGNNTELQAYFPHSFYPDQRLLLPESLLAARPILEKHFPIPRNATAEQLDQFFENSLFMKFKPCENCKYGTQFQVTTTDPKATHEALSDLHQFFLDYNAQLNLKHYGALAEERERKIQSAMQQRIAQVELAPQIFFARLSGKEAYLVREQGVTYLLERQSTERQDLWRLVKYRNPAELKEQRQSKIALANKLKRRGSDLSQQTLAAYQAFFKANQAYLDAVLAYESARARLSVVKQLEASDHEELASLEALEARANQVLVRKKTTRDQQEFSSEFLMKNLKSVTDRLNLMASYPYGEVIELAEERKESQENEPTNEIKRDYEFHKQLDFWMTDRLKLERLIQEYRLHLSTPIELVKSPSLDTIAVSYRLNFKRSSAQPGEAKPLSYDDFRDITFSKKILALFLLGAGIIGVLSAMGRAYWERAKEAGSIGRLKEQLKEAIAHLKP